MDSDNYAYLLYLMTVATFVMQIYVIYLINYKTPASTRQYCYFLYLFVGFDLIFTFLLDVGIAPETIDGIVGSNIKALGRYLSPNGQRILVAATVYAGALVVTSQDYCLIYRFTVIQGKSLHRLFMSWPSKIIFNLSGQLIAMFLGYLCYMSTMDEQTLYIRMKNTTPEFQQANSDQFFIWFDFESVWMKAFTLIMLFSFVLSEAISVAFVIVIFRLLKRNSANFSRNTYRLHRQFTLLLAVQLALPAVLILIPAALALGLTLVDYILTKSTTQIGVAIFSTYAFINSAFTILFITPYREDFKSKMKSLHIDKLPCCKGRFSSKTTISQLHSNLSKVDTLNIQTRSAQNIRRPNTITAPVEAFN